MPDKKTKSKNVDLNDKVIKSKSKDVDDIVDIRDTPIDDFDIEEEHLELDVDDIEPEQLEEVLGNPGPKAKVKSMEHQTDYIASTDLAGFGLDEDYPEEDF